MLRSGMIRVFNSFLKPDSSHFSVDDWLRALIEMELWLEHKNLALKREARVTYIECALVADNLSDLATVVRDFLEAYGCEQANLMPSQGFDALHDR